MITAITIAINADFIECDVDKNKIKKKDDHRSRFYQFDLMYLVGFCFMCNVTFHPAFAIDSTAHCCRKDG